MAAGFASEVAYEEEEEEEEQLVVMELSGIIDLDFLEKCDKCKILGIDTAKPILQVDKYVFAGEYADALGTCVVFEEDAGHVEAGADSGNGSSKPRLKYKCHTVRKLNMTRTFLTDKKEDEGSSEGGVEFLQLKDNDFSRPNMICNFLQQKEEEEVEAAPLLRDQSMEESEEDVVRDGRNLDLSDELENSRLQMEGSVSHSDTSGLESESCAPSQTPNLLLETVPDG